MARDKEKAAAYMRAYRARKRAGKPTRSSHMACDLKMADQAREIYRLRARVKELEDELAKDPLDGIFNR